MMHEIRSSCPPQQATEPSHPNNNNNNQQPKQLSYLLIENPSKSNNLGPILRCATAFAVHQVIFVGYEKCSVKGSHGSSKHVNIKAFVNFEQAVKYLKEKCGIVSIIGIVGDVSLGSCTSNNHDESVTANIEDDEQYNVVKATGMGSNNTDDNKPKMYPLSYPVHRRPFPSEGNVCFSISRKSIGLPIHQAKYCDIFIHVQTSVPFVPTSSATPKQNSNTSIDNCNTVCKSGITPTLDINDNNSNIKNTIPNHNLVYGLLDSQTCLSITLHHFNAHAGYDEQMFEGQKFHVERNQVKGQMFFDKDGKEVRKMRLERKEQLRREAMETEAEIL